MTAYLIADTVQALTAESVKTLKEFWFLKSFETNRTDELFMDVFNNL